MGEWQSLTEAHRLLQSVRPLPPAVTSELGHRFEVRLTHHSTAIEGNTLTQSETQIVIEKGITIAGKSVAEHLEVIGHKEALDLVLEFAQSDTKIGERHIKDIHAIVTRGQEPNEGGVYRTLNVKAAGTDHVYPGYLEVPNLMFELCSWLSGEFHLHPINQAVEIHNRFVAIHPFRDGNGRVGRLLMNLMLVRFGYPIAVIPVERRSEYINSLVTLQTSGNVEPFKALISDSLTSSFIEYFEAILGSKEGSKHEQAHSLTEWLMTAKR